MEENKIVIKVEINKIKVKDRLRKYKPYEELAESIKSVGLINPITIDKNYNLICGLHRLETCKSLGHKEIDTIVIDSDDKNSKILEIDENLARSNLTDLEFAEQLKLRKELYEGKGFTGQTAKKLNISKRSVEQSVQIANNITPEVKAKIKGTKVENSKTDLLAIAKTPSEKQENKLDEIMNECPTEKLLPIKYKLDFVLRKVVINAKWENIPEGIIMENQSLNNIIFAAQNAINNRKDIYND